ncbi:hypothetical protein Q0Z83_024180 [Actinoplanes sichuanensis]|nr:hypothetical protein Q0Z83_024180 [Actinoplanes sichuanensis]
MLPGSFPRTAPLLRRGDPAPGDSEVIAAVIARLRDAARTAGDAVVLLGRIGADVTLWTGPAADACGRRRDEIVRRLQAAESAYTGAAEDLTRWLQTLGALQATAAQIAREANDLQRSAETNNALTVFASPATPNVPGLAALQRRHDDVAAQATAAAKTCAVALGHASDIVEKFRHSRWQNIGDVLHDVSDVLGTAVLVLTVASAFPPLAPLALPAAAAGRGLLLAVDVAKLGVDLKLVADGDASWSTVGGDTVDVATGGLGAGFRPMAKAAKAEHQLRTAAETAGGARFATGAAEAADELAVGFTAAARREILHPVTAFRNEQQMTAVVQEARQHAPLPSMQRWLPPDNRRWVVGDALVQTHEANEVRKNVQGWIGGDKR